MKYVGLLTFVLLERINLKTGLEGTSLILKIQILIVVVQFFILSFKNSINGHPFLLLLSL